MFTYSAVTCKELTVTDGTVTYTNLNYSDSVASFECNPGYTLMGEVMATCLATGEWSTNIPHCIGTFVGMSVEWCVSVITIASDCEEITQIQNGSLHTRGIRGRGIRTHVPKHWCSVVQSLSPFIFTYSCTHCRHNGSMNILHLWNIELTSKSAS